MSKGQAQEAYKLITAWNSSPAIARELTEQTRIQSMTESIPRGEPVATYWNGNLRWESHYLKPDFFLALSYNEKQTKDPDPYTERGLKGCQAWIFNCDRQHSRLTIVARNSLEGNRSFSQLAYRLATE